jgi:hypothetical protein
MRHFGMLAAAALGFVLVAACSNTGSKDASVSAEPKPAPAPAPTTAAAGTLRLGSPIEASAEKASLTDVAKNPSAFAGKKFATTGTVTAVCQHMGCWMEIKDDSGEAHIKMAGHSFFVPKTAAGHKARVLATLVKEDSEGACSDEGMTAAAGPDKEAAPKKGCRAEAEAQLGHPLAKLELIAEGVELM